MLLACTTIAGLDKDYVLARDSTSTAGTGTGAGAGGGGGGGGGGAGPSSGSLCDGPMMDAVDLFDALRPNLVKECGLCHYTDGYSNASFLGTPGQEYGSLRNFTGVVVSPVSESILLTVPSHPPHHGDGSIPALTQALELQIQQWLCAENALVAPTEGHAILEPIHPKLKGGTNFIPFDELGQDFAGSAISFSALELNDPPSMLMLTDIEVHTTIGTTLHIKHPLFTMYPLMGEPKPDVVDSFDGVEQDFTNESDATLGTGTLILNDWQSGASLGIGFEQIQTLQ